MLSELDAVSAETVEEEVPRAREVLEERVESHVEPLGQGHIWLRAGAPDAEVEHLALARRELTVTLDDDATERG